MVQQVIRGDRDPSWSTYLASTTGVGPWFPTDRAGAAGTVPANSVLLDANGVPFPCRVDTITVLAAPTNDPTTITIEKHDASPYGATGNLEYSIAAAQTVPFVIPVGGPDGFNATEGWSVTFGFADTTLKILVSWRDS